MHEAQGQEGKGARCRGGGGRGGATDEMQMWVMPQLKTAHRSQSSGGICSALRRVFQAFISVASFVGGSGGGGRVGGVEGVMNERYGQGVPVHHATIQHVKSTSRYGVGTPPVTCIRSSGLRCRDTQQAHIRGLRLLLQTLAPQRQQQQRRRRALPHWQEAWDLRARYLPLPCLRDERDCHQKFVTSKSVVHMLNRPDALYLVAIPRM